VISLYAVYLGYSAVSKNPNGICNPQLASENDTCVIAVGLLITAFSLALTGWSWTAEYRLGSAGKGPFVEEGGNANGIRMRQDPFLDLNDLCLGEPSL